MKRLLPFLAPVLLAACAAWTTGPQPDDPDDRVMHVGSHIPYKDNDAGKTVQSGDAQSMIQNQKLGSPNGGGGK